MTCHSCTAAELQPLADGYVAGCLSCAARAMAVTRADLLPNYRDAAKRLFGDQVKDGHELVKRWLSVMRQKKARAA